MHRDRFGRSRTILTPKHARYHRGRIFETMRPIVSTRKYQHKEYDIYLEKVFGEYQCSKRDFPRFAVPVVQRQTSGLQRGYRHFSKRDKREFTGGIFVFEIFIYYN